MNIFIFRISTIRTNSARERREKRIYYIAHGFFPALKSAERAFGHTVETFRVNLRVHYVF